MKHFLKIIQSFLRFVIKIINSPCYKQIVRLHAEISVKKWMDWDPDFIGREWKRSTTCTNSTWNVPDGESLPGSEHGLPRGCWVYKFLPLFLPPLYFYYKGIISVMAEDSTPVSHCYPVMYCTQFNYLMLKWRPGNAAMDKFGLKFVLKLTYLNRKIK